MTTTTALPHWDMTVVYPGLDSPEYAEALRTVLSEISHIEALFDRYRVGPDSSGRDGEQAAAAFDAVVPRYTDFLTELHTLQVYTSTFVSTNSRDTLAQARMSELQQATVPVSKLSTRFTAWIGSLDVATLLARSELAASLAFALRKVHEDAQHQMPETEENLVSELELVAGSAWSRLHGNVSSQLMVPLVVNGEPREVPMSVARQMAVDPDRSVRRSAFDAELVAWQTVSVPLAAALNSIKGETNILDNHRGWESALDLALLNNNIDRQTLDAMLEAARDSFPDWRRYFHIKARALGLERLAWYDLSAPVAARTRPWDWDSARTFLLAQFGAYSPRLQAFAARAFEEQWIDAEPRPGKRDGAFCTWLRRDESRVMTNFKPSFDGMSTLAHELGHAYHNYNLADRTLLQRGTPMTLAETASIFCETIVREAALTAAAPEEQVGILEASLQGSSQIVVDIYSRFLFERAVFERRRQRELSVDELCALMVEAQNETYGDAIQPDTFHPYMWAVKGHYYSTARPFYNFPYMFGLLFGLGLYARFRQDPEAFRQGYDELLSSTGMAPAAELAQRFGIDIRTPDFWRSSLDICRRDIDRLETLMAGK